MQGILAAAEPSTLHPTPTNARCLLCYQAGRYLLRRMRGDAADVAGTTKTPEDRRKAA